MSYNITYYFHKILFYLTTPALVACLYYFGGNETYFDSIYIVALCLSCIFCWSDKDTLGALLILLGFWCTSKLLYMAPDEWSYWLCIYGASLGLSIYNFHRVAAKIVFILTLLSICAEFFWWYSAYINKPEIHYWIGLLALTLWARQLLFNRVFIAHKYFGYLSGKIALDVHIGKILSAYYALVALMILEYFVRHLAHLTEATIIYYLFSPLSTVISALTLAIIYMHYFHNQSQKHLLA